MYPFVVIAAAVALYFAAAALTPPRPAKALAAVLWSAYAVYEYYVANGTLCDPGCNIRVDLVLFFPLLGSAAYLALQKAPRTGAVAVLATICLALVAALGTLFGKMIVATIAGIGALIVAAVAVRAMVPRKPE